MNETTFFSPFWHWFIVAGALFGIVYCVIVLYRNNGKKVRVDEQGKVDTTGHVWDEDISELDNPLPAWWAWLYLMLCLFAFVYLLLYPGLGTYKGLLKWTQISQYQREVDNVNQIHEPLFENYASQPIAELAKNKEAMRTGKRLFQTYCATCHGSDMRGNRGFPNLRDNDWLYGGDPETIKTTILNGRNGVMPSQLAVLGPDVDNVIHYLYSINEDESVRELATLSESELAIGEKHFSTVCAACHGQEGLGTPALGAPNLVDNTWLYGGDEETLTETLKNGRAGVMPDFKEFLGEEKVTVLAAYVYHSSQAGNDSESSEAAANDDASASTNEEE